MSDVIESPSEDGTSAQTKSVFEVLDKKTSSSSKEEGTLQVNISKSLHISTEGSASDIRNASSSFMEVLRTKTTKVRTMDVREFMFAPLFFFFLLLVLYFLSITMLIKYFWVWMPIQDKFALWEPSTRKSPISVVECQFEQFNATQDSKVKIMRDGNTAENKSIMKGFQEPRLCDTSSSCMQDGALASCGI